MSEQLSYTAVCSGPCTHSGTNSRISRALHVQRDAFIAIAGKIAAERFASLTPERMRAELQDLGRRIDKARGK